MHFARRLVRTVAIFLALLLCLFLAAFSPPNSESQAAPSSPAPPSAKAPAPKKKEPAPESHGLAAEVDVDLAADGRTARVVVKAVDSLPASSLKLYRHEGEDSSVPSRASLPALESGERVVRTLSVGPPIAGDVGLSPAVEVGDQTISSAFVAARGVDGRVVTAATVDTLDEAALRADRRAGRMTEREFRGELAELREVPGSESSKVQFSSLLAAEGDVTVSGRAEYTYWDETDQRQSVQPARGALVQLVARYFPVRGPSARVQADGSFTISGPIPYDPTGNGAPPATEWQVELVADASVIKVYKPNEDDKYAVRSSAEKVLLPGNTWTGVDIAPSRDSDAGHAFAILDAGYTIGDFYDTFARTGWDSSLKVSYPRDATDANSGTHLIRLLGGVGRHCGGSFCEEDAFDWDVLAHEVGHVVASQAGISASPGGAHSHCEDLWQGGRSKEDAAKFAWSEGWATFWGTVALRTKGRPPGLPLAVGDVFYDDLPAPPNNVSGSRVYDLENGESRYGNAYCGADARSDSSEFAVQLALWDFWDGGQDNGESTQWGTADMFDRLWDADTKTFWAAWQALTASRTSAQVESARTVLEANGFAPTSIAPTGQLGRCPREFTWDPGGSARHPNARFWVRVTTVGGMVLTTVEVGGNEFTPGIAHWKKWSSYGTVHLDVGGEQAGSPYGPYRSGTRQLTLGPPNTSGCVVKTDWSFQDWSADYAADQTHLYPVPENLDNPDKLEFAGHPLDITFDNTGAAWGIGEFGLRTTRTSSGGVLSRHNLPLKVYLTKDGSDPNDDPDLWDWTKPFTSWYFRALNPNKPYAAGSDLAESIIAAGPNVWAAYGGEQNANAVDNHSILARYPTDDPHNWGKWCAVPLPGDNNEVIGLAYDSQRRRVWFAESTGDHRQGSGTYSTIGWVKESGLGSRCQNELDFGGRKGASEAESDQLRAAAQQTVNSLQCTAAQQSDPNADCVHIIGGTGLPSGATHMEYDPYADALWVTNWCDRNLRKYDISSGQWSTAANIPGSVTNPPAGSWCHGDIPWQVAANSTHVFFNEYESNRILRYTKSDGEWSVINIPVSEHQETHSITLNGNRLWFTVSDEDYNSNTHIGYIDLANWDTGANGRLYGGWHTLSMNPEQPAANKHSFRGIDVGPDGRIALADHGDMATVILTPR